MSAQLLLALWAAASVGAPVPSLLQPWLPLPLLSVPGRAPGTCIYLFNAWFPDCAPKLGAEFDFSVKDFANSASPVHEMHGKPPGEPARFKDAEAQTAAAGTEDARMRRSAATSQQPPSPQLSPPSTRGRMQEPRSPPPTDQQRSITAD